MSLPKCYGSDRKLVVVVVVTTSTCCAASLCTIAMCMAGCACTTAKSLYMHGNSCYYVGEGPLGMWDIYNKHGQVFVTVLVFSCEWLLLWLV